MISREGIASIPFLGEITLSIDMDRGESDAQRVPYHQVIHPHLIERAVFPAIVCIIICIFIPCGQSDHSPSVPDIPGFLPLYVETFGHEISLGKPYALITNIRDPETQGIMVMAWGSHEQRDPLDLSLFKGQMIFDTSKTEHIYSNTYPLFLYFPIEKKPTQITSVIQSEADNDYCNITVSYFYGNDSMQRPGRLHEGEYSVQELVIPPGVRRAAILAFGSPGTDIDLFLRQGAGMPASFEDFTWAATSSGMVIPDSDPPLSEILAIDDPEPGPYTLATVMRSGDDDTFTLRYLAFREISPDETKKQGIERYSEQVDEKYAGSSLSSDRSCFREADYPGFGDGIPVMIGNLGCS